MKSWYRQTENLFDRIQIPTSPLAAGFDADFSTGILPHQANGQLTNSGNP